MSDANSRVEKLLWNIQRGSTDHLWALLENWPGGSALSVTRALLEHLTVERHSPGELDADDFCYAHAAMLALSRAVHEATQEQRRLKTSMKSILLPHLDCVVSWMSFCVRYARKEYAEDEGRKQFVYGTKADRTKNFKFCVVQFGTMLCNLLDYDKEMKAALQASRVTAEFVALIWLLTDKVTGQPLFMLEPDPSVARKYGCLINVAFSMFSDDSEDSKIAFLKQLCPDGNDAVVAKRFIEIGVARLKRMKEACEKREWESLIIGRNIRDVLTTFDKFLALGIPEIVQAFNEQSFLGLAMATVHSLTQYITSTEKHSALAFPLTLILDPIQSWSSLPGSPPLDAMAQLLEGGLVSVLISILVGAPWRDRRDKLWKESESLCWDVLHWIVAYSFYPPTFRVLNEAVQRIGEGEVGATLMKRREHWSNAIWLMMKGTVGLTDWVKSEARTTKVCDNVKCDPHRLDRRRTVQKECTACGSAIYCSEKCQEVDWHHTHREDCPWLKHERIEREYSSTWLTSSARILHLSLIQEVFRLCVRESTLEAARERTHPGTPLSQLIVVLDFCFVPIVIALTERANVCTVPEFLQLWGKSKKEGGLGEMGVQRLQATVKEFLSNPDVRLVQALFRLKQKVAVWVLARVYIPRTEDGEGDLESGVVVGGISALVVAVNE